MNFLAERNHRTRKANRGSPSVRVYSNLQPVAKHQHFHAMGIHRMRVECLDTCAQRCLLKLFADFFRHPCRFRQEPHSTTCRRCQTRIRIQAQFNSFGISGHGTPRGLRRRLPCIQGNNTNRLCKGVRCPFLCRSCSTFRTCSRTPACRTANTALDRRASLSPGENFT